MLLALQHPELVSRLVVVDIAPKSYGSLERFSGYIEEMQRLPLGELTNRGDAEARFEESNAGVKAFLLQNLRRDGDSWRWQANLELFAADAAKGTGSVIAAWPERRGPARALPRSGAVGGWVGVELHHRRGPAGDARAVPEGAAADGQGRHALGAHRRPGDRGRGIAPVRARTAPGWSAASRRAASPPPGGPRAYHPPLRFAPGSRPPTTASRATCRRAPRRTRRGRAADSCTPHSGHEWI